MEEQVSTRILTVPNVISFARLSLVPAFAWAFFRGDDTVAFILLAIVGTTDWIDGFVARKTGQVSVLGKLIDPVADRVAIITVIVAFAFRGTISWPLALSILLRDAIATVAFSVLEARGFPRIAVSLMGKAATALIYTGMGFAMASLLIAEAEANLHLAGTVLLTIGSVLYWSSGFMYAGTIRRSTRVSKEA